MPLATKLSEFVDRMKLLLETHAEELGIPDDGVFYGDQTRIPTSPAVCIEGNSKAPELYGAGRMTEVTMSMYLLVYHSEVRDVSTNRRDADKLGEAICDLINADATFFDMAIHCYVTDMTSGYSTKVNTTMRAVRITWEAKTQERLPNAI
jgi:hypothetical protein